MLLRRHCQYIDQSEQCLKNQPVKINISLNEFIIQNVFGNPNIYFRSLTRYFTCLNVTSPVEFILQPTYSL